MSETGFDPRVTPWSVKDIQFESLGSVHERAAFLVGYATLAPSGHNTQPWKFSIGDGGVSVLADDTRRLPVADGDDRELRMSIGAAVMNLRVAAARFGYASEVDFGQVGGAPGFLASVRLKEGGPPDGALAGLFPAITKRRTNRFPYSDKQLAGPDREALEGVTRGYAASALIVTDAEKKAKVADLVLQGDEVRMSDKAFRRELSEWVRPNGSGLGDGITADALGIPGAMASILPWVMRTFNMGKSQGKMDAALVRDSAAMVVIRGADTTESLVEAGEVMEALVLEATLLGIQYSFFNLPVEVPELRAKLKDTLGISDLPQLLLRVGYADPPASASPRRLLESVIVG